MSCVWEFKEPFVTALALISLACNHVFVDKFDKLCDKKAEQLIFQTKEKMFKIGDVSFVKVGVEQFVAFTKSLCSAT